MAAYVQTRLSKTIIYTFACISGLVAIGIIGLLYGRISGNIQTFTVPTPGSDPAIPIGSYLIATKWKQPQQFDFMCYFQSDPRYPNEVWVQRVCAMPGDTVRIVAGVLYVNGVNVDEHLRLKHEYKVTRRTFRTLVQEGAVDPEEMRPTNSPDSVVVRMEDAFARNHDNSTMILEPPPGWGVAEHHGQPWSRDTFGPLVVPEGHWFMLGDNRHASMDSRYIGCVPVSSFRGTVWKVL